MAVVMTKRRIIGLIGLLAAAVLAAGALLAPERQSAPTFAGFDLDVVAEIHDECGGIGIDPRWCYAVAAQEGGLTRALWTDPRRIGDGGVSCGPFQINTAVGGRGPCSFYSSHPAAVANSVTLMAGRWRSYYGAAGGTPALERDPVTFMLRTLGPPPNAQGSLAWTVTEARDNWSIAVQAAAYLAASRTPPPAPEPPPPVVQGLDPAEVATWQADAIAAIERARYAPLRVYDDGDLGAAAIRAALRELHARALAGP